MKFQLVNDHTAGHFALNATIPVADGSFWPDNLTDLGSLLIDYHQRCGRPPAWLFKTDASSAYRLLPCHPWWQVWQVMKIDGDFHIDQCCVFGNQASGALWCAFYMLVLWVGIHVRGLNGLLIMSMMSFHLTQMKIWVSISHMRHTIPQNKLNYWTFSTRLGSCMRSASRNLVIPSPSLDSKWVSKWWQFWCWWRRCKTLLMWLRTS